MFRGIYSAASGMLGAEQRTAVAANNLANVSTDGYKKDLVVQSEFHGLLLHRINSERSEEVGRLGGGSRIDGTFTSFTQGGYKTTGNPLDVAIVGDGFFAVETAAGTRYTRNGSFQVLDGFLATSNGLFVLNPNEQRIPVPADTQVRILADGTVTDGQGGVLGEIGVFRFTAPEGLVKQGGLLFEAVNTDRITVANRVINVGVVELSNVDAIEEMVVLIEAQRAYEAGAKIIQTYDQTASAAIQKLGVR